MIDSGLRYTEKHEWVRVDGDVATIGITHHAQDALGEVVFVDLPEVGDTVEQFEQACEVESVKAVSEVYSPVSGEVTEVNEGLDGNEGVVNSEPYGGGWFFKVQLSDPSEVDQLLDAAGYEAYLAKQG